jgi:hypothetical protein
LLLKKYPPQQTEILSWGWSIPGGKAGLLNAFFAKLAVEEDLRAIMALLARRRRFMTSEINRV